MLLCTFPLNAHSQVTCCTGNKASEHEHVLGVHICPVSTVSKLLTLSNMVDSTVALYHVNLRLWHDPKLLHGGSTIVRIEEPFGLDVACPLRTPPPRTRVCCMGRCTMTLIKLIHILCVIFVLSLCEC